MTATPSTPFDWSQSTVAAASPSILPDAEAAAAPGARQLTEDELRKAYIPRGYVYEDFMYDQSPIVGLSGPAGTGKSRCALEKIHLLLEGIPGARAFIARKTRESLTEAALFTYEEHVLPAGHPCLGGAHRVNRSQYLYPNGSMLVIVGLDKPQRIMSTEFDVGYIQEAVECDAEDIEMLTTRLRNGRVPYQQLIFDCNPDSPQHWIYQRFLNGKLKLYDTRHEDNPVLWQDDPNGELTAYDGRRGRWTPKGIAYIANLEELTGPRYHRLRHGKWVTAEGAVYAEVWDPRLNLCNKFDPPKHWRRFWTVDFGYTHPFVLQMWAVDGDGRMWMYKEIYRTRTLVRDNAINALNLAGWEFHQEFGHRPIRENPDPLPEYVVMDWDAEGRATFEEATGLRGEAAYKSILDGIDAMAARLRPAGDGLPRMFVMKGVLVEVDDELKRAMQPICTAEEFTAYIWDISNGKKQKEMPLDKYNHGMDAARYGVAREDGLRDKFKAGDVPMVAHTDDSDGLIRSLLAAVAPRRDEDGAIHRRDRNIGGRGVSGARNGRDKVNRNRRRR